MNTEKNSNRKEWIKNAAIIFLSVMLVLTFFSNTIMNYSLPEVATVMIEPGSINAKIRGTGNLTSDDPYKITIQESRTIASVAVKQGDVVEKDQVLFYLEDEDSQELEEAEKALDELLLAYSSSILNGGISQQAYENIQGGKVSSTAQYQERINAAKQKVADAQTTVENLEKQIAITGAESDAQSGSDTELAAAKIKLNEASASLQSANTRLTNAQNAKNELGDLRLELDEKIVERDGIQPAYEGAKKEFFLNWHSEGTPELDAAIAEFETKYKEEGIEYINELHQKIVQLDTEDKKTEAANDLQTLKEEYKKYSTVCDEIESIKQRKALSESLANDINAASVAKTNAQNYYNECDLKVKKLSNQTTSYENNKEVLKNLEIQKVNAQSGLQQAQEELDQLLKDISSELNLGNQNSIIREQREKIAKLREEAVGAVITAPVAGTVTTLNKIAGEKITPNEDLAILQPEGKGFSMSFSVTPEQAKKVTVGEQAEIQNSWFYNDITATLVGIRPDPESNGTKKLLVFDVKGDVQAGQSVSLSIGQRSASYDLLVPNSAVREDNNGKFILIVEAKNSPLGNRYIATRIDVEVLGADDNKTAISAPLYGYEYVITTSTQPVEAGKQVRLAEN